VSSQSGTDQADALPTLDALLRFDHATSVLHEAEHGAERVAALRHVIVVGLLFFDVSNVSSIVLMPDVFWYSVASRIALITPGSLLLAWAIGHVREATRERLVTAGMSIVIAAVIAMFWASHAHRAGYMIGELPLFMVYGNMLMALRFRHAILYTASTFALVLAAIVTKAELDEGLRVALLVQVATCCTFSLYANYRTESARCRAYLDRLRARFETRTAEAASSRFLDLSMTDALTGLPNRRALDRTIGHWSAEARAFCVVMIDVDHFKAFNDSLGHPAGDECLREVTAALSRVRPPVDHLLARFGGEEFTLVAADLDPFAAARLGGDLVATVARLAIPHPSRSDGEGVVTISAGVALARGTDAPRCVFKAADEALYRAKRNGRNRCHLAEPLTIATVASLSA
jgi:diguanylate cyclase (GGDEF)-like protein